MVSLGAIDYDNGIDLPLRPCFDNIFLERSALLLLKFARAELFHYLSLRLTIARSFNVTETVHSYEQHDFSPQSFRLNFLLDRTRIFSNKSLASLGKLQKAARYNIQTYHDAQKEVLKLEKNEYLQHFSQEESRNRTIQGIWNVADLYTKKTGVH